MADTPADASITPPGAEPPRILDAHKTYATFVHLSALSGFVISPIGFVLGPLIMWLIKKDEVAFIDRSGRNALNFQITFVIVYLFAFVLFLALFFGTLASAEAGPSAPPLNAFIGIIIFALVVVTFVVINIVFTIMAGMRANRGEVYDYPLAIRFFR